MDSTLTSTAPDPSAPAGAVVTASDTYNTFLSTSGLNADTDYYFQVSAANNNGISTGFTAPISTRTLAVDTFGSGGISDVGTSSLTVAWTHSFPAGEQFYASLSTDDFVTVNLTSITLNASVVFGAGGEGAALAANTTYYARVSTDPAGPFTGAAPVSTLAAMPAGLSFDPPTIDTIQLNWSDGGNGPGVLYTVLTSTAPNPSAPVGAIVTASETLSCPASLRHHRAV